MVESIITNELDVCFVCKRSPVEIHHVIFGTANRDISDRFGLVIPLCAYHHRIGPRAAHRNRDTDLYFKKIAQRRFTEVFPQYDFREVFGKEFDE